MAIIDSVDELLTPILSELDLELYDLVFAGGVLKVAITRPGGIDLDAVGEVNRRLSRALDLHDPIPGAFTLEVTSPGLERKLRTDLHWDSAIGEDVKIKLRSGSARDRRVRGVVLAVDSTSVTLRQEAPASGQDDVEIVVARADIDSAKTVFEWKPAPTPRTGSTGDSAQISEAS